MIIIMISGGLGNQMFQYAFYLSVRKMYDDVKIDTSVYKRAKQHNGYELEKVFGIHADVATEVEIKKLKCDLWRPYPKIKKYIFGFPRNYITHANSIFYPSVVQENCYYAGTWNNLNYFSDVNDEVIEIFGREQSLCGRNYEVLKELGSMDSVAVHIRRGDYVGNAIYDGLCTIEYYKKAIEIMDRKLKKPKYFFFSNDIEYVRKYFSEEAYQVISWNQGENSYLDMYLMSRAKNNIIAHSTFSWWAAWLNRNVGKTVIAPQYWFNHEKAAKSTVTADALLPADWIRITGE